MNNTIYYILAGLLVIYLLIGMANKRTSRKRRSRKFMEDYERKDHKARSGTDPHIRDRNSKD